MSGSKQRVSYREQSIPSLMDFGVEFENYSLSTENSDEFELSSDSVSLFAGFYFWLYPKWLRATLDLKLVMGVSRMHYNDGVPLCSERNDVPCANGSINDKPDQAGIGIISEFGISASTSGPFFWGLSYEQQFPPYLFKQPIRDHSQNDQISESLEVVDPKSIYLTFGYRFGSAGAANNPGLVPSGPRNTNDPCRLFGACN
jgi:hypothetical protein